MNDHGYTLSEMLVALVMIGLAVGGLTQGTRLLSRMQTSTTTGIERARALRLAHEALERLVEGQGPFSTKRSTAALFVGSPTRFQFDCRRPAPCGASIGVDANDTLISISEPSGRKSTAVLSGEHRARFIYGSNQSAGSLWPPVSDKTRSLNWIALVHETSAGSVPIMSVRLWKDEAPSCEFDTITRDCRSAGG